MTRYKEAVARCKLDFEDRVKHDNISMCGRTDIEALEDLLSKVLPRTVVYDRFGNPMCPRCHSLEVVVNQYEADYPMPVNSRELNHCEICGQTLEWISRG